MDLDDTTGTQARFRAYAADLASVLGHADRVDPFKDYCIGLLSAEGRKSVEPLAAVTAPERTGAQHQSLLHFVAQAPWCRSGDVAPRARACAAIDHPGRTDPGVDHRRHWLSQEGQPLGRRGAAVLRPVGQAAQLPSRGQLSVATHQGESACCLPVVCTEGMGRQFGPPEDRRRAG